MLQVVRYASLISLKNFNEFWTVSFLWTGILTKILSRACFSEFMGLRWICIGAKHPIFKTTNLENLTTVRADNMIEWQLPDISLRIFPLNLFSMNVILLYISFFRTSLRFQFKTSSKGCLGFPIKLPFWISLIFQPGISLIISSGIPQEFLW